MRIASEASRILTNKYFLYFMVFLATTNVLGYLVTNKINAVIFFGLISGLTYHFSKNMSVVLLVALIATNFLVSNKRLMEGLENQEESTALSKVKETDPEIAKAVPAVKKSKSNDEVKQRLQTEKGDIEETDETIMDINNADLNKKSEETDVPEGVGEKITNKKTKTNENFGPRLDYAATIEQSYQNLDNILGTDSIKQLTTDTQKLMAQQQNLFNTMNQMVPVLEGAQNMLKNFKIDGLADSLKKIGGVANAPIMGK